MDLFLLLSALLGHAFLWIGLVNRLHALGIWRRIVDLLTAIFFLCAVTIPITVGIRLYETSFQRPTTASWGLLGNGDGGTQTLIATYSVACWGIAAITLLRFACFSFLHRTPPLVRFHGRRRAAIDLNAAAADPKENAHHFLARLPLNEILRLDVSDWTIDVPRLAPALDGLSIVHLSDFHFTGRVGKAFFREVVRTANELQPDLIALTGDLVDSRACIDWIPDTLGRLTARYGVYFILGNHDLLTRDVPRLRRLLEQSGLVDLGSQTRQIEINGHPILLTGNERPWIKQQRTGSAHETPPPAARGFAGTASASPLRIVLSHSPDQLGWARKQDADLMLAGHTHGGQIHIPPLGAIFSPSVWGVKHISGVYYSPPTILHVTRGISGDTPARWLCPPEIARLTLRSAMATAR
jgi:predicted MPP superfamily phosphohydrolase